MSAEAQALLQYNTELANLEQQTGTILETHGVWFFEERFNAIGPLGRLGHGRSYPGTSTPGSNDDHYPTGERPSEEVFNLQTPEFPSRRRALPPRE